MACGIALKRPLELDSYMSPEGVKRPRTTTAHCSPFRPAFITAVPSSTGAQSPSSMAANNPSSSTRPGFSSPFHNVSTRLSSEQLESYLRAEIRYLRRRKLIPKRNMGVAGGGGEQTNVFRAPVSPNSSDSDGESQSNSHGLDRPRLENQTGVALEEKPQFTFKQVQMICDRLLKEQEGRLRSEYESVLSAKLSEQYDTFVKFTQDQIHRQIDNGTTASYLS